MLATVPCNACGGADVRQVLDLGPRPAHNANSRLVRCAACALVFVSPRVERDELERQYVDEAFQAAYFEDLYLPQAAAIRATFRHLLALARARRAPPARLRDVGFAIGLLADEARALGYEARGHELSPWAVRYARERFGLEVATGPLADLGDASEDVIALVETIEHLPDPLATLRELARILRPGGLLVLTTPNWSCVDRWCFGRRWDAIAPDGHLYYFDARTLARHLERAGFADLELETRGCRIPPMRWSRACLALVERAGWGAQLVALARRPLARG